MIHFDLIRPDGLDIKYYKYEAFFMRLDFNLNWHQFSQLKNGSRGRLLQESFHKIRKYKLTVIACKINFFCRGGEIVLLSSGEIFLIAVGGVMCSSNKSYSISFLENLIWTTYINLLLGRYIHNITFLV